MNPYLPPKIIFIISPAAFVPEQMTDLRLNICSNFNGKPSWTVQDTNALSISK